MTPRTLITAVALLLALAAPAHAATAGPDPTFNGSGLVRLDDQQTGVALQPDGKLVVLGEGLNGDFGRLRRLNADGSLDQGFGDHGIVTIDSDGPDPLTSVLVEPDGDILVGGGAGGRGVLYRFTPAGAPDQGFGTGGRVTLPQAGAAGNDGVFDVAERGGTIVAVGESANATTKAAVWRRHAADGSDFGTRTLAFGTGDSAAATAIQPDGRILVGGTTNQGNNGFVSRLDSDLGLDPSFHGGTAVLDAGGSETVASIALQPDGKVVAVGRASVLTRVMVTRLTTTGELDPAFNGGASQFLDTGLADFPARVLVQPDGKLVIVGSTDLNADVDAFRLTASGAPDHGFADDSLKLLDAGGRDTAADAALQPDGDIVAVGASGAGGIVARLLGDPLPLTVATAGNGTVRSAAPGIDCGVRCTAAFDPGTQVTLTATPAPGSRFAGWSGCASATATCVVALHAATSVTASFAAVAMTHDPGGAHPGTQPAGPPLDRTAPRVTRARLNATRFRRRARHATLRLRLSETAAATFTIRRGSRTVSTQHGYLLPGDDSVLLRLPRPGRYTLVVTAVDAAGNHSAGVSLKFRVLS
jgi:uncharacterized delta-60 repeat protein